MEAKRIGVIGIVIENPPAVQEVLNQYISDAGQIIIGRIGVPYRERNVALLALLVDGSNDEINSLTGRLGSLPGVNVRAALAKN
ncbi:MAG TPA: CopG family transcriptional regulator [Firmicutes bacterium]|jgi:putative iron-only hydrogenase system regulator|nr:CopG family transcriptional regulator [Bacillota bacterium]HBK67854.1 CopG family transcriptional regulator [Bacillota bacterium]HBT16954.1 CopG family transcriptional regulator [Bacillota bacterium]